VCKETNGLPWTIIKSQAHYNSKLCLASTAHLFTHHR